MIHSAVKKLTSSQSLYINTVANFIGLGYSIFIGLIVFPLYLKYLGAEAFGLVGFFTVLQSWMQLLDMGMSPMLSRQTALARAHCIEFIKLKKILRSLELIILFFAIIVISGISACSPLIAHRWLNIDSLDSEIVIYCIILMGTTIGCGFFSSLYRSGIRGMEEHVLLNIVNVILITLKFVGALLLLRVVTRDFFYFFFYQFFISIIEAIILRVIFYRSIPLIEEKIGVIFFWSLLKPILPFAGGIAYTAGIWILLTQADKLILSKTLPLSKYGYFVLVATVSTGISQISVPISQAILPRMTYLLSHGKEQDMLKLYKTSTQYMAILIFSIAGMIAFFSYEFLFTWTGDRSAAEWAAPILTWFVLGNGILCISAFQYYLQFAHGNLKMHVIYNTISACIEVPIIIYTAFKYGAIGVSLAWFTLRIISFVIWTPIVHYKFAKGLHRSWLIKDILPVFISTILFLLFIKSMNIDLNAASRPRLFILMICLCFTSLLINIIVSSDSRNFIIATFKKKYER